jgi:hypothetical protein
MMMNPSVQVPPAPQTPEQHSLPVAQAAPNGSQLSHVFVVDEQRVLGPQHGCEALQLCASARQPHWEPMQPSPAQHSVPVAQAAPACLQFAHCPVAQ